MNQMKSRKDTIND